MLAFFALTGCLAASFVKADAPAAAPGDDGTGAPEGYEFRDLLAEVPNWSSIKTSKASEDAIEVDADSQIWGDLTPESDVQGTTLCKWDSVDETCKTDISWLLSSVGIYKELFDDELANYYVRFHAMGLCYRFQRTEIDGGAQDCPEYIFDQGKNAKVAASDVCYSLTRLNETSEEVEQLGCAHLSPDASSRRLSRRAMLAHPKRHLLDFIAKYEEASDMASPGNLYDSSGFETIGSWGKFFECRDEGVTENTKTPEEKRECWNDLSSDKFGLDVPLLRQVIQMIQNETRGETGGEDAAYGGAMCHILYNDALLDDDTNINAASTAAAKKDHCETINNDFIIKTRLPDVLKFEATLEEKQSLARTPGTTPSGPRALPKGNQDDDNSAFGIGSGPAAVLCAAGAAALALLA